MYTIVRSKNKELDAVYMTQCLLHTEVLLDNQANISIVNLMLLRNVREAK
jgi:hypothetical protein